MTEVTPAELQTAAVKGSIWTSLHATVSLPLAVVANILVARALGPVDFGFLATLIAAYGIAVGAANAGISDATIQWGARAYVRGATEDLVDLVRRCSGYHLVVELPLMITVTAVLLRNASEVTQFAACLAVAFGMYIGTAANVQMLLSRTATVARVAIVTNVALQVTIVVSAEASHSGYVTWTARIVAANLGTVGLLLLLPRPLRTAVLRPRFPRGWPPGFVSFGFKTAVGGIVALLVFSRSEIFVLQADRQHAAAGVFALGFGIAAHMTAPIDALLGPMMPAAVSLVATAPERLGNAVLRGLRFTAVAAGGIAAVGIPLASALVVPLFGSSFEQVASLILPLALVSCIQSLNHPVTAFLYGLRRVGNVLVVNLIAFSIDIGIAIATIGALHAWGATIANVVGQLLALGGAAIVLKRALSLSATSLVASMRTFGEGAVAATFAWLVVDVLTPTEWSAWTRAVLGVVVGGGVFLALQRLKKPALTSDDVAVLVAAMPQALRRPMTRTAWLLGLAPSG